MNPQLANQQILTHLGQQYQKYQRYLQSGNLIDLFYIYAYLVFQIRILNPELPPEIGSFDNLLVEFYEIPLTSDFIRPHPSINPERLQQLERDVLKMRTLTPILYQIVSQAIIIA